MKFQNLKISAKLAIAFSTLILVFVASAAVVLTSLNKIDEASTSSQRALTLAAQVEAMATMAEEQQNALRGYVLSGDADFKQSYEKLAAKFDASLDAFEAKTTQAPQKKRAQGIRAAMSDWRRDVAAPTLVAMNDPAGKEQASGIIGQHTLTKLRELQEDMRAAAVARVAIRTKEQADALLLAKTSMIVGGLASLAIASLMGWLLSATIGSPVNLITTVMRRLASGDNSVEIPAIGRKDEVGEMAEAVAYFKDAAIEKLRLESEAAGQRAEAEAERQQREREKAAEAEADAFAMNALAQALDRLASGDLTYRITAQLAPKTERLKRDFNAAADRLRDVLRGINGATGGIRSGSEEIAQASDDLSRRTEQQAASLEETAAALDEITATVRKTASGALEVSGLVAQARAGAERSGAIVEQAVSAMSEIETSSSQVNQIISVIDEIAFQTNLLALNAGVEAARAGDAGKGFAVVAQEVRALAQRSAEAAKEIKALISTSTQQVGAGVDLVAQTGDALRAIVGQVASIDALVKEIAASAQEQSTGLHQVNVAVNQMDQVVQQNAAMVEEATAATHSLKGEAGELAVLVSRFQVGDANSDAATRARAA
ncbi:methyl-accepting chemotaxis protein [Caulobacter segnis]|uniref:Methyl-accepting chemotaxis sensory transducer n=2 Tax=Caulobacter segnis TaxID=88688 RepID=D5VPF7_CAUST|nr:methyl-accepting chemotaxis protein [Caulobacter segnis]ADG12380.1 methyl-accepting chemotaxis sensory transducer [Caulobacter segnis ATCC 21756]AVQ03966.1 methyl-accepting chemotaxis protein [Caulobacter segnis]